MIDHLPVYFMDIFSVCILFLDVLLLLLAVHFLDRTALPLSKLLDFCSHSKMMLCWQRYKIFLNMPMHLNCHTVLLLTTDIVCHFMNVLWHWEINECFSNMIKAIFVRSFSCSVCVCVCVSVISSDKLKFEWWIYLYIIISLLHIWGTHLLLKNGEKPPPQQQQNQKAHTFTNMTMVIVSEFWPHL